jgi:DNA-binding response OmpR family regulator/HPt (histidine-containing phosphotransfer) domain-containing protein
MPPVSASREEEARLADARAEFIGSLPRRLETLRAALRQAEEAPADADRVNGLLRRAHAVGSAARVLGFASVAEALAEAERAVRKGPAGGGGSPFQEVSRALDLLPSLVLGAPAAARSTEARARGLPEGWPLSALVFGPRTLADALTSSEQGARIECESAADVTGALELARIMGPDVIVADGDDPQAQEFVTRLLGEALIEPVPIVVVASFDNPENSARFVELGAARVLPKPYGPDTLRRTVEELRERAEKPKGAPAPLGDISVAELSERIAAEFKRGLVDALDSSSPNAAVPLGEGHDVLAAVWGAVTRVRELVTLRSEGGLRFEPIGPEGAVPVAAFSSSERRAGERAPSRSREGAGVSLQGRRIVVADDDPAVVWFMSGLLKAVGVEVLEAHDGRRALELVFDAWPDAVISDVLMPKLDGFSLCHEIKRDVAVRDVPVILLSWKEDLLQRVRELGAAADGYLRKEAAASTVVERVREVLRPRARVEERVAGGGEVRGRLDGLTPRLILELACRDRRDVRISLRDAAFLFEAQIRRGQLVALTRSSADGKFVRGPAVLGSLLGAGAGRFVVEPDSSQVPSELRGTLREILTDPIARARASLGAVSAASLVRLRRLEVDRALVEPYLACTPEPAAGVARRVLAGESPAELVLSGSVPPQLLEVVLSDMARRDAVAKPELDPAPIVPTSVPPLAPAPAREMEPAPALAEGPAKPADEAELGAREVPLTSAQAELAADEPAAEAISPPPEAASDRPAAEQVSPPPAAAAEASADDAERSPPSTPAGGPPSNDRELSELVGGFDELDGDDVRTATPAGHRESPEPAAKGAERLPFDAQVTPAADPTEPLFNFGEPAVETLEGMGVAPVSAPEPSPDAPPQSLGVPVEPSRLPTIRPAERDEKKRRERADKREASWVAVIFRTLLAGAVAFGVTSWLILPLFSRGEREAVDAEPAASAAAPGPAPAASAPPLLQSEELEPPEGIELQPGYGLLEVETAGPDPVYVDEAFVGRGPMRRVPLPAGRHSVEVRGEPLPSRIEVSLAAGRRVRIPAAGAAAPAASAPR